MTYAQMTSLTASLTPGHPDEYISRTDQAELDRLTSMAGAGLGDTLFEDPEHAAMMHDLGFGLDDDSK